MRDEVEETSHRPETVYLVEHTPCTFESEYKTISVHLTEAGAIAEMTEFIDKRKAEDRGFGVGEEELLMLEDFRTRGIFLRE